MAADTRSGTPDELILCLIGRFKESFRCCQLETARESLLAHILAAKSFCLRKCKRIISPKSSEKRMDYQLFLGLVFCFLGVAIMHSENTDSWLIRFLGRYEDLTKRVPVNVHGTGADRLG